MAQSPSMLLGGVDNLLLDNRTFSPTQDDIHKICRFFSIGKCRFFVKEKDIVHSHSNFFILVTTALGRFALKFYPVQEAKTIALEYAVNTLLTAQDFPTPVMHQGPRGQTSMPCLGRRAACYSYIKGLPAWQRIKGTETIGRINDSLFSLKQILSVNKQRLPQRDLEGLGPTLGSSLNKLLKDSRSLSPYTQQSTIEATLLMVCRSYQEHRALFTRQWLHNNAGLTNFIVDKNTVYTLDLSHVKIDYTLSDLASLIISCLFFDIPPKTIKTVVKDYFTRHNLKLKQSLVLNDLVKTGLIKEYLKNIRREQAIRPSDPNITLADIFKAQLSVRKELITGFLIKLNKNPGLLI